KNCNNKVSIRRIESLSQVQQSDIHDYLQENVWKSFLRRFFEKIDEEATFTTEFKEAWQTFMSECLIKMIEDADDLEDSDENLEDGLEDSNMNFENSNEDLEDSNVLEDNSELENSDYLENNSDDLEDSGELDDLDDLITNDNPPYQKRTPSTSKSTKLAYTISIKEYLKHILNNLRLMTKIYFGRGIKVQKRSEMWHSDIWQWSPLYNNTTIIIKNVEYTVEQFVEFIYTNKSNQRERRFGRIEAIILLLLLSNINYSNNQMQDTLKMSRLLSYDELGIYCSKDRSYQGHKEL
ncbi:24051_t:CDS:2, partial [Dentiscutata erythropus]